MLAEFAAREKDASAACAVAAERVVMDAVLKVNALLPQIALAV
jgi:hypothetical protein